MGYRLGQPFLGSMSIEIDEDFVNSVFEARRILIALWEIEDCFGVFVESFIEFEKELQGFAVDYYYSRDWKMLDEHSPDMVRARINLKILTFLSAAKAYEDYSNSRISKLNLFLGGEEYVLKDKFSSAHGSSFEYRLMCGLRNFSQHRSFPLDGVAYCGSNEFEGGPLAVDGPSRLRITVDPHIKINRLLDDSRVTDKLKRELRSVSEKFENLDLKYFVRGYLGKVAEVHVSLRLASDEVFRSSLAVLEEAFSRFQRETETVPSSLYIFPHHSDGTRDEYYIHPSHFQILSKKRMLGSNLVHVQRGYTSSEIVKRKDTFPEGHEQIWIPK